MRRKIVKQGYSTLMISLPSKWAKKNKLDKGAEVDVEEKESNLIISPTEIKHEKKEITLNVENLAPLQNRLIISAYKKGYDIIHIKFSEHKTFYKIQKKVFPEMIGFEIIEQGKQHCTIAEVSKTTQEEFNNILKRVFYTLKNMLKELIRAMQENDKDLEYIIDMDYNINKYVHFCERIINKKLYSNEDDRNILYYTIIMLDAIGDSIKQLVKKTSKNKIKNNNIKLLEKTYNNFEEFINLFYNYNLEKSVNFAKNWQKIIDNNTFTDEIDYNIKEILKHIIKIFEHSLTMKIDNK